jgi:carbon monoxide dehydrogenase subunit G
MRKLNTMKISTLLISALLGLATVTALPAAYADVWQISLQNAKRDAHYLINTHTATVTSMRSQQCIRSFKAKMEGEKTATPKVTVEADISGGGAAGGMRATQEMIFILREGSTQVTTSSTVRGSRPPIAATGKKTCVGAACVMTTC